MKPDTESIIKFLKENIEPIDDFKGLSYCAAAYLSDGTYLPCVVFRNRQSHLDEEYKTFEFALRGNLFKKPPQRKFDFIYSINILNENNINCWDISKVEKSKFALPKHIFDQIDEYTLETGEGFVAKMKDGNHVGYGSNEANYFFPMPEQYSTEDIVEIINQAYVLKDGTLSIRQRKLPDFEKVKDYKKREKAGELGANEEDPMNEIYSNKELYEGTVFYREKPYFVCYLENL